jgi:tripartite ATP-independent transporter DctM subunit
MGTLIFILFALLGAPLFTIFGAITLNSYSQVGRDYISIISDFEALIQAPTLMTIPLFTFAGYLLSESGAPKRLVAVAKGLIGWMPGGIPFVAILACAFFTAFTGASGITIIALGGLMYPMLMDEKYGDKFSLGLITTCGSLGLLFPPSLPIILYGVIGNVMIDKLFIAGLLPGFFLMLVLGGYSVYIGSKQKVSRQPFEFKALVKALKEGIWEWPLPIVIIVGIFSGWFTPNDAAPATAFYVLVVEVFIYREIRIFSDLPRIIKESMLIVGGILIILGIATAMTRFMIIQQVPDMLFAWVSQYISSQAMFLLVLNLFLLIVGCLMDIFSAIIVVVPLIAPIALRYGVDPFHLAIIFLTNLEIGYITPPVGLNLFLSSFRFKRPVLDVYRLCVPFMVIMLLALAVITYVPWLSTALVEYIYGPTVLVLP